MFYIDDRILSTSVLLAEWPLSTVLLKNEKNYPWLILVPRKEHVQELYQLEAKDQILLMEEINQLSVIMHDYFKPEKLNIGALGNIVAQLHIHIVGRYSHDPLWPQGIWQEGFCSSPLSDEHLKSFQHDLEKIIRNIQIS